MKNIFWIVLTVCHFIVLAQHPSLVVEKSEIQKVVISDDGNYLAAAYKNQALKIWSLTSQKTILDTKTKSKINDLNFSKDGKHLITVSNEHNMNFWGTITGKLTQEVTIKNSLVDYWKTSLSIHPDGSKIAFLDKLFKGAIYDIKTESVKKIYFPQSSYPELIRYSPDGKTLYVGTSGGELYCLDSKTGSITKTLKIFNEIQYVDLIQASKDGKYLLVSSYNDKIVQVWNTTTYEKIKEYSFQNYIRSVDIDVTSNRFVVGESNGVLHEYSFTTLDKNSQFQPHLTDLRASFLLPKNNLLTVGKHGIIKIWNADFALERVIEESNSLTYGLDISHDEKQLAVAYSNHLIKLWDTKNFTIQKILKGHSSDVKTISFHPTQPLLLSIDVANQLKLWDTEKGILVKEIDATNLNIKTIYFTKTGTIEFVDHNKHVKGFDDNYAVLTTKTYEGARANNQKNIFEHTLHSSTNKFHTSKEGLLEISDIATNRIIAKVTSLNDDDFMITNNDGYYYASKNMLQAQKFKYEDHVYDYESFDIEYNRPDLVYKNIDKQHAEIPYFEHLYKKRISKLTIAQNPFKSIPTVTLYADQLAFNSTEKNINFSTKLQSIDVALNRLFVSINGVPLYGREGLKLESTKDSITIELELSEGENFIQISCNTVNGIESLKETMTINYNQKTVKNLYFIGIGASTYPETGYNLKNVNNDVSKLLEMYEGKQALYDHLIVDTLTGTSVTTKNIAQLKQRLNKTTVDDIIVLYYAGHGLLDQSYNYYLATNETVNFNTPEVGSLPFNEIEDLLDNIPSRKKVLLVNACNSGEYDQNIQLFNQMKKQFYDLRKNTGTFIISSSNGDEASVGGTRKTKATTVFGYSLLKAMEENNELEVHELNSSISKNIELIVQDRQNSTVRQENYYQRFRVW